MAKPQVVEQRFDFRGGRNTAISSDLLNPNELVDCTNARLSSTYGGFAKRSGSQRIHGTAFPASVQGVTQWDILSGKQIVVISNGTLWWRNGFDFPSDFTSVTAPGGAARTTANQGNTAGWTDPDGIDDGTNSLQRTSNGTSTVIDASKLLNKLGDPTVDNNLPASDNNYTVKFTVKADTIIQTGHSGTATSQVTIEYSLNSGGTWTALPGTYTVQAGTNKSVSQTFSPVVNIVTGAAPIWIRLALSLTASMNGTAPEADGSVQIFNTVYKTDNFPVTWTTGASLFSTTQPAFFAPFRASSAGAPLVLYIASGGHYYKWDGVGTLTQLDPTNSAPLATNIISYHTRMFAGSASTITPGLLPKTIFWSALGDATDFRTGDKTKAGSPATDFSTG